METNPNTCGQDGEEDRMLNSTSCPNNPPTPCVRKTPEESDLTPRVSNSFVHVPEHQLTARVIIGRCKWYSLLISILLSGFLNIVLMTTGVWYGVQPWYHVTKYHRPRPFNLDHQREFMHHTGVTDLVSLPCNSRASLTELFPPMIMEYANISETQRRQPYCYLPHSEHLTHLLRIMLLSAVNKTLGVETRHCVSLNGQVITDEEGTRLKWIDNRRSDVKNNIFAVLRNTQTSDVRLNGPSGYYLVTSSITYKLTSKLQAPTWATLEARGNGRRLMSQTKIITPSHQAFTSLSFHDVVHINKDDYVTFHASHSEFLYQMNFAHSAHMCCIPVLGGCGE